MKLKDSKKKDIINIAFLALVFAFIILFSRVYTLHPIDDDWSYIRAAETFYNTGEIKLTPWTSPSLIFQVLWGGLFAWIFGFSINTLILSTQVISFIGLAFYYLLLRETQCDARKALFFTLLFVLNPFSFPLLYTFFTDHSFIALMFISTFFYYRGVIHKKNTSLFCGSVFASCALLVRQPGLLIPLAVALYLIVRKSEWKMIFLSILLPVITFSLYTYWFRLVHLPTFSSQEQIKWIIEGLGSPVYIISKLLNRPLIILEFFGFCLMPFSLAMLPLPRDLLSRRHSSLLIIFCLSGVLFYLKEDHIGVDSAIYSWLNGFHFAYVSEYGYRGTDNILLFFYKIFDFLALFSITFTGYLVIKGRNKIKKLFSSPILLLVLIPLLQLAFLMIVRYKFTRYYLILLPFFFILICQALKDVAVRKRYFYPLLAGFALFAFIGTQDFLSWNEAHWKLGNRALGREISPRKLSGGFPWDCWHNIDYCAANPYDIKPHSYDIPWWFEVLTPAIDPEYLISNSAVPSGFFFLKYFCLDSYRIEDAVEYFSLLYLKRMKIFLLKRKPRSFKNDEGEVRYRFLENFKGAEVDSEDNNKEREKWVKPTKVSVNNITHNALAQPSLTEAKFRVSLPPQKCRLKVSLATWPQTWDSKGDGVTFKIKLSDHLLENFFDIPGMVGMEQRSAFVKPRSYFFASRTIYMHYLCPKDNPDQRKWNSVSIDLTRFSGKVVDITFKVEPGPRQDARFDVALWGDPVIETY